MSESQNRELDKVLQVGDETYNINAVKADQVSHKLKFSRSNLTGGVSSLNKDYDGSEEVDLVIVPAEGGKFTGRITVPDDTRATISGDSVLNYNDIKNVFIEGVKNDAIVFSWDGSTTSVTINDKVNSISIVQGPDSRADAFAAYNKTRYANGLGSLPTYLYIGTDEHKVFYGTRNDDTAALLEINSAGQVAKADQLSTNHTFKVDLGSSATPSFDGTSDVTIGVTGTLPMAKGGLGGNISSDSTLAKKTEYYVNSSIEEVTTDITDDSLITVKRYSPSATNGYLCQKKASIFWTYIAAKIRSVFGFSSNNILSVAKGGTGATALSSIEVGTATKAKKVNVALNGTTYQAAITISSSAPSSTNGTDGDIWIKY